MEQEQRYQIFAAAIVAGKSKREAAIAAGYSEKSASQEGSRQFKREEVQRWIAHYRNETSTSQVQVVVPQQTQKQPESDVSSSYRMDFEPPRKNIIKDNDPNQPQEHFVLIKEDIGNAEIHKTVKIVGTIYTVDGTDYDRTDPKDFLSLVHLGVISPSKAQLDAARAALPFEHAKQGEIGKKDSEQQAAQHVMYGNRFAPNIAPKPRQTDLFIN